MLAGHHEQAKIMMEKNRKIILESGASTLVTSCPICYKVFSKEYNLPIKVVHHTQYLLELAESHKITLQAASSKVVYHDPCELSRDLKIYDEPRKLLARVSDLSAGEFEKDNTLCCGNSLANFSSGNDTRNAVARDAYEKLVDPDIDFLVTSCPMCKKSFEKVSEIPVRDIAEMVSRSMKKNYQRAAAHQKKGKHAASVIG
jgi:Fe-S oxidoreductase